MSVRFIIGRAGTGKTHHCLQAIRRSLLADPLEGPRLLLLVPEQASLQMERALVAPDPANPGRQLAVHRAEVLSFRRLAYRLMESGAAPGRPVLSEAARAMVLRHLLDVHAPRLRYYGRARHLDGLFDRLEATMVEFIEEMVEPAELDASKAATTDPSQAAKFHDLQLLYREYLHFLSANRLDPTQHLSIAREQLSRCHWLSSAELWVDGFASFSAQEAETLVEMARRCLRVEVTAMFDSAALQSDATAVIDDVFYRTRSTFEDLRRRMARAGVVEDPPLLLAPRPPPRFHARSSLAQLEQRLFSQAEPERPSGPSDAEAADASPADLQVVSLPTRRLEVEYAVAQVCAWVQDAQAPLRFRDAAIIVRDLTPYHDLLSEALSRRNIPFFMDRRRPVAHHPLIELLRALLALAREDMSLDSVRRALKTGLLPLSAEAADELENHLLAHGTAGLEAWRSEWTAIRPTVVLDKGRDPKPEETARLGRINANRLTLLRTLEGWLSFAPGASASGSSWAEALRRVLGELRVEATLDAWSKSAEARAELGLADEHRHVGQSVGELLDNLAQAFGDAPLSLDQFTGVVDSGLSRLSLGLVPPTMDPLLVGSIDRSRHPELKAVVLLGFNDGVFPRSAVEDSILNDDDRDVLRATGLHLRPSARQQTLDERLLVYTAVTRAGRRLVLTYASADEQGKALRPSPYLAAIREACPAAANIVLGDPWSSRATWPIQNAADLARGLAVEFRNRPALRDDDRPLREQWNGLYERVRPSLHRDGNLRWALRGLDEDRTVQLTAPWVDRLLKKPFATSVSQMETYAACPFQYFTKYVLRLNERSEAAFRPVDVGQVDHALLEDIVGKLAARPEGFRGLDDTALNRQVFESHQGLLDRMAAERASALPRDAYGLRRTATSLLRVLKGQRTVAEAGAMKPAAVEVPFGTPEAKWLKEIALQTPAGNAVQLRGYIDRIDFAEHDGHKLCVVIDYKRTPDKRLEMDRVFYGLSLQLPVYLWVLATFARSRDGSLVIPAAGLYVSLVPRYDLLSHPSEADEAERLPPSFRPRGLISADSLSVLEPSLGSGWAKNYAIYRDKQGGLGYGDNSDGLERGDFAALLNHAKTALGRLVDALFEGDVAVRPYRLRTQGPCAYCEYRSVCRFEMGLDRPRMLPSMSRTDVLRILNPPLSGNDQNRA